MTDLTTEAESFTAQLADELLAIRPHECIACYVLRMLHQYGCNGTRRFAVRWRDRQAPRATALERRLATMGSCCCDCELLFNVWETSQALDVWNAVLQRYEPPQWMPACAGGRPRSTKPCANGNDGGGDQRLWSPVAASSPRPATKQLRASAGRRGRPGWPVPP